MKAIVAVDRNWNIGNKGELLFRIKEDMKFFKETTIGKVVVMGRKTFESLPNKQPLKDRTNLVITSSKDYVSHDNVIFGTLDEIKEEIDKYSTDDVFIIGGANVYKEFMHECSSIYVTHNVEVYEADTSIPNLAFEGFKVKKTIKDSIGTDNSWRIVEWENCINKPYNCVLCIEDSDEDNLFAYSDDLDHWRNIFSNTHILSQNKIKNFISSKLELNKLIKIQKIRNKYKAEVHIQTESNNFRIATFADADHEAWLNLIKVIMNA